VTCCELPYGSRLCHCARCHQTFGSLGLFDSHQSVDYSRRFPVLCAQNDGLLALGLVRDNRGVWLTPEALVKRAKSAAQLTAHRQDRSA
jgi:hypothetical protein